MEIRGIIHCHSTYSYDAKLSLREIRELCLKNNVQFVCMTEHVDEMIPEIAHAFVAECEKLSDEQFCFIPGFEVPYPPAGTGTHAHVLMIGLREYFGNYAPTIEVLRKWTEHAAFVVLAHPVRNHFRVDAGLLKELHALEIWNQQYEGKRVPRIRSMLLLAELREEKQSLLAVGGVDFHRKEHFGAPLITLEVEKCTEKNILEKLKSGAFTISSDQAMVYGTLPNIEEVCRKYGFESFVSVSIIVIGKFVNTTLARLGISLPKSLKQFIRRKL